MSEKEKRKKIKRLNELLEEMGSNISTIRILILRMNCRGEEKVSLKLALDIWNRKEKSGGQSMQEGMIRIGKLLKGLKRNPFIR